MLNPAPIELRVGIDVGAHRHAVAVGLSDGNLLEQFEITHEAGGFRDFFTRIETHAGARSLYLGTQYLIKRNVVISIS